LSEIRVEPSGKIGLIKNHKNTWRLTMEFNIERLKPLAEEMTLIIRQELAEKERHTERDIEQAIRQQLQELGRQTFGLVLSQADDVPERELVCTCGGTLKYQRRREALVLSLFGWVKYQRSYYAGCSCGKGRAPLDERLGLRPNQVTSGLASLLGMAGIEMAFDYASGWLQPFLLFEVSENTIRKETQGYGEYQLEREAEWIRESQDPDELQVRLRTEKERPQRVYGSIDGAHVRIEERSPGEEAAEKEKWREMKVGCWYQVAEVPKSHYKKRHRKKDLIGHQVLQAKDIHYFCDTTEVDEFEPLFWATGCRAKADLAKEVVFVCDGAKWPWRLVETYYPKAVQILDWFHAEERLEKVAEELFSSERAKTWLDDTRTALWQGNTRFVIRACEKLAPQSETAAKATTYFRNNAQRMRYDVFREQGYLIGSGTVESACKQIVTRRLKVSGAQWNLQGARLTAKARAAWLSGDWEDLCSRRDHLPLAV
jgi:hypothetical protein